MIKLKEYRKGIQVTIYRTNSDRKVEFLIMHRVKNWTGWELVKGGIDPTEDSIDAAKRELFEEIGCNLENIQDIRESQFVSTIEYADKSKYEGMKCINIIAKVSNEFIVDLSKNDEIEHDGHKWCDKNDAEYLLEKNLLPAFIDSIRQILQNDKNSDPNAQKR